MPTSEHALLFGTNAGSLGAFCPVDESVYKRLETVQKKLTTGLEHRAGLNPKAHRMVTATSKRARSRRPERNVLNGGLLAKFLSLGVANQRDLARRSGTSVEAIVGDIRAMLHATSVL
jgi:cleavage and polyadenylation specificity factor subunit 1